MADLLELPKDPQLAVSEADPAGWSGDLLVIGLYEEAFDAEKKAFTDGYALEGFSSDVVDTLIDLLSDDDFKLKPGSSKTVRLAGAGGPKYVAVAGLGKAAGAGGNGKGNGAPSWGKSAMQVFGSTIKSISKQNKCAKIALFIPGSGSPALDEIAGGILTGGYEATRFKSKDPTSGFAVASVDFLAKGVDATASAAAFASALAMAKGITVARYLVEAPPNVASPKHLAACAEMIEKTFAEFGLTVYGRKQCEEMGMGCYLGVGEASDAEPQFIHLKYTPPGGVVKSKIAFVGKGVTFDSGGYNIKAGAGSMIEMMKFDMGGSAAVLGSAYAVGGLKPENVEVHFITAACENMINGHGLRPGDILTASNGKTVEVNNTDAEGRLTLCDAIVYASKQGVGEIVDIATLTGACIVALGMNIGGLYSNSDDLASSLLASGSTHGEKWWRMPLEDTYMEHLKSPIADMKNTGIRWGGSITAALFLQEFIPEGVNWAHLDMAGPVWDDKSGGATGFGAATLAQYAVDKSKQ